MADETTYTTPAGQDPAAGQEPGGETFDEARAKALIAKLRDEVKATKGEAKELAELRQARKTADEAALTEQQKLAKRAADLEAENTRISAEALADRTNARIERQAARLGAVDPELLARLIPPASIERDADGTPTNLEALIKDVLKARPYLVATTGTPAQPATSATNGARQAPAGSATYSKAQLADYTFYSKHKDDIQAAMREGRIVD